MSKSKFSGIVLFGLVVALSLVMLPALSDARNSKVGILDAYTGPAAVFANDALNGFKLAVDEINKKGVLGGKIEYTTRDTKFKVDIGLNMAKELVMNEKVDLLVGTINRDGDYDLHGFDPTLSSPGGRIYGRSGTVLEHPLCSRCCLLCLGPGLVF